ncbi:MAG: glycoside hydrolase [Planctomycetaceae bacterium]|nr:glycoside hydrolase [Planctomycetaceae bacterium]
MQTSRRKFLQSAGITSTLLGVGGVLPGFSITSHGFGNTDNTSVYYDQEIITVCKADKDFPRHSEASIIELADSSLLMAWQRFEGSQHGSGDQAPSTIALMNSPDGGRTWGNFRVAAVCQDENSVNVYSPNFLRLKNGEILLLYMEYNQLESGKPQLATAYTIRSQDEGKTFCPPEPAWQRERFGFSNSCMMRLSSGRVILPIQHTAGELWSPTEKCHVRVFYSDDDCKTWTFSDKNISLPMRGTMEPFVAELKDGRLIMVLRNQLGSVFKSYSDDQGENWSLPQTTGLSAPESCPYVTTIPGSDKMMVIWNHSEYNMFWRSHYGKRSPLTAAISSDGGVTFTDFWDIETDPKVAFSNPGMTWTRDGVCLLTYWACPYSEDWVMSGLIDLKLARFRVRV